MNKKIVFSVIVVMCFLSLANSSAFAEGAISGGGGRGVVCRDAGGSIISAEALDLYEGRVMYGIQVPETNEPMRNQIERAANKLTTNQILLFVKNTTDTVQKAFKFTPKDVDLVPVDDSFEIVAPRNCKIEQLANYYNDNLIMVNGDIWEKLSETDKAALVLHESVYKWERVYGAKDSRRTRKLVAQALSGQTNWIEVEGNIPNNALKCFTQDSEFGSYFYAFKNNENIWTLQFVLLGGQLKVSKAIMTLNTNYIDFSKAMSIEKGEDRIGGNISFSSNLNSNYESDDFVGLIMKWETVKDAVTGEIIRGYQRQNYYLVWKSGDIPGKMSGEMVINCSLKN